MAGCASSALLYNRDMQFEVDLLSLLACLGAMVAMASCCWNCRRRAVYVVEFVCVKPADELKVSRAKFLRHSEETGMFSEASMAFQRKIMERSGLGEETYAPPAVVSLPPRPRLAEALLEAELAMFGALDQLFTTCAPSHISILVVNCSLFAPTPSLSSIIINRYKMREDILSFNLSGMGCSAGLISMDLASRLLQVHAQSQALVVSTENMTLNWYMGNNRSMLLANCIFRYGGAAILLSNAARHRRHAKYELAHLVRTHNGADDGSFGSVFQRDDDDDMTKGLSLSPDLMHVAGDALHTNIATLAPLVLPFSEQFLFLAALFRRKVMKRKGVKAYVPDFKLAFHHFCLHAGGRAVLDAIEKKLGLRSRDMEPSRMTLHRFGNTSSSSLWYELAYLEAKGRVGEGDRIWLIAFGSGFKCNSAVLKCLHAPPTTNPNLNPWISSLHSYPLEIPAFQTL